MKAQPQLDPYAMGEPIACTSSSLDQECDGAHIDMLSLGTEPLQVVGEGNANVVVTTTGCSGVPSHQVLRLTKVSAARNNTSFNASDKLRFQTYATCLLFGSALLPKLAIVPVTPDSLTRISTQIAPLRSPSRKHRSIDLSCTHAMLMENTLVALGDGPISSFAIEIKPKWGFQPLEAQGNMCRFCAHQILKSRQTGGVPSQYCPLLLFSSSKDHIEEAIRSLLKTPNNNIKLFAEGGPVEYSQFTLALDTFFGSTQAFVDLTSDCLLRHPLLSALQHYQRSFHLDPFKIQALLDELPDSIVDIIDTLLVEHIQSILEICSNFHVAPHLKHTHQQDIYQHDVLKSTYPETFESIYFICKSLISMTLKDASIVLVFDKQSGERAVKLNRVRLIDMDPKSINSLPKWIALQRDINEYVPYYTTKSDS
ncbi:hypothetical protein BSLG_010654 [Batrachochytrium salamandrivorans]|nr:hypothetical protein BSLG_010654 [Batrachochytrium salamandrivorans]